MAADTKSSATDPVDIPEITLIGLDLEASASRVGPAADEPESLGGTDAMGFETGGLAGTSR